MYIVARSIHQFKQATCIFDSDTLHFTPFTPASTGGEYIASPAEHDFTAPEFSLERRVHQHSVGHSSSKKASMHNP